jgi:hypothetical protein
MHNFDPQIANWRRQLLAVGIKNADVLDELESHLREEIERRSRAGADVSRVFEMAAAQFGQPQTLKAEFDRVNDRERKYMKRIVWIGAGILGVLVGMALVMPAVAQYRHEGAMRNGEPWLFLIGSLMTLAGGAAALGSLKRKRA